jgi:aspartokinase
MGLPITKISFSQNITLITLTNIPTSVNIIWKIFTALGQNKVNVDMISQSSPLKSTLSVSFTLADDDLIVALNVLKAFRKQIRNLQIEVNANNSKISLYGEKMKTTPGIAAKTLEILTTNNISILMITTSDVDISYLIYTANFNKAYHLFADEIGYIPSLA